MVRRRNLVAVVIAMFSLSIPILQPRAGQLEDMQRQVTELQSKIQILIAKQRSLEQQQQREARERQAKQQQLEKEQEHEAQERQAKQQQLEQEQAEVKEQASSGFFAKGDFPGSYKIPGTNTSLRLGGHAKLDIIHDFNALLGDFVSFSAR